MISDVLDILVFLPLSSIYASILVALPEIGGVGGVLIQFAIVLNLALVPLYHQMERQSKHGSETREKVRRDLARIKKHFRGRERYFYVRATYRQYDYHPIHELLNSLDLWIQVLVFATVYWFLVDHPALVGVAFGPITDLSKPDSLLGGINALPIIMTLINFASVMTYVEDRRRRWQGIGLATFFLVILYNSASGLVIYWTTNNLFSFVRNVVQRKLLPRLNLQSRSDVQTLLSQR